MRVDVPVVLNNNEDHMPFPVGRGRIEVAWCVAVPESMLSMHLFPGSKCDPSTLSVLPQ